VLPISPPAEAEAEAELEPAFRLERGTDEALLLVLVLEYEDEDAAPSSLVLVPLLNAGQLDATAAADAAMTETCLLSRLQDSYGVAVFAQRQGA